VTDFLARRIFLDRSYGEMQVASALRQAQTVTRVDAVTQGVILEDDDLEVEDAQPQSFPDAPYVSDDEENDADANSAGLTDYETADDGFSDGDTRGDDSDEDSPVQSSPKPAKLLRELRRLNTSYNPTETRTRHQLLMTQEGKMSWMILKQEGTIMVHPAMQVRHHQLN